MKDAAYLEWLRTLPCCLCLVWHNWEVTHNGGKQTTETESAHVGARGLGQKCDDREALPICAKHHRTGAVSHHVLGRRFWTYHGLDREALIAKYQKRYEGIMKPAKELK